MDPQADDDVTRFDPSEPERPVGAGTGSPYRNLWVPLIVVPFLVVAVIALVFVFFGLIRGQDASIAENLERVVSAGENERKQAAVSLAAQVHENRKALAEGKPPPWEVSPNLLADIRRAWDRTQDEAGPYIKLTLAQLAALYEDPDAAGKLSTFLALSDTEDPSGEMRVQAMLALSWVGGPGAAEQVIPFLAHSDRFLSQSAAGVLQAMPGEATTQALRGALGSPSLELRGQAALSLAALGDPAGAEVLRELIDAKAYSKARMEAPRLWNEQLVHASRLSAVRALGSLKLPEDRPLLEELTRSEADSTVREAAMLALQGSGS